MAKQTIDFRQLIEQRRKWYTSVHEVHCRFLNEKVTFNSHGFKHTLRDGRNHYRTEADARMRLNLLPWAPVVIRNAAYMPNTELREAKSPRNRLNKPVTFFELQGTVNYKVGKRARYLEITVILRRIGDGTLHYYSIRYTKNGIDTIEN